MGSHLRYGYVCPCVLVHVVGVVVVIVLNSIVYIYNYIHCILCYFSTYVSSFLLVVVVVVVVVFVAVVLWSQCSLSLAYPITQ